MKGIKSYPRWLFWSIAVVLQLLLVVGFVLLLCGNKPTWSWELSYAAIPTWNTPEVRINSFGVRRGRAEPTSHDMLIHDTLCAISVDYYNTESGGDGSTISYEIVTDTDDLFCYRLFDTAGRGTSWTVTVSMEEGSVPLFAVNKGGDTP